VGVSEEDRARAFAFLEYVVAWSGKSWDALTYEAGLSYGTVQNWRTRKNAPEGPNLLKLMRAAGALADDYTIKSARPVHAEVAREELEAAEQALADPLRAERARRARGGRDTSS
jgi:hypothetical protein